MMIAIDLSPSMNAIDVPPSRLQRVRQKVMDLLTLRSGSRTGLIVYSGTAHLVLPPAEDTELMKLFLPALDAGLMPVGGRDAAAALKLADGLLKKEVAPGTIVFITDGFDTQQIPQFRDFTDNSQQQVLVLTVGTTEGGPLQDARGRIQTDANGVPLRASLDEASLRQLADDAGIPLASITLDSSDIEWVERRAQHHVQIVQEKSGQMRWREFGYYLCFPIALIGAFWFRRGWVVRWAAVLVIAHIGFMPTSARAESPVMQRMIDWFATPDQQGRWLFDKGEYREAAAHFHDPMWKGLSLYRAGDYRNALVEFSRPDTAEAFFLQGNAQARLRNYEAAVKAYDNALRRRAPFPEAVANRELVARLIPKPDDETEDAPDLPPDQVQFDDKGKKGKEKTMDAAMLRKQSADLWMKNLRVSPADFLRQKFRIEAQEEAGK